MTSELQRQVERLRASVVNATPLHQGRASLFLDPHEAASVDIDTIFDTARNSLNTLQQYDERFARFHDNLMHPSSVTVQRELKTPEENAALEKELKAFLDLIALYAEEVSTHKVLEYLIRRYRINELNADLLIRCMLPYHDSKIFARIVQLSSIANTIWFFLEGVKTSGAPPPRQTLVYRCSKDIAVLLALCQIVKNTVKTASNSKTNTCMKGFNRIISFFTAVIIETCQLKALSEQHLQSIYPFVVDGLRAPVTGPAGGVTDKWRQAATMVLMQVAKTNVLGQVLLDSLTSIIVKTFMKASGENEHGRELSSQARHADVCAELVTTLAVLASYQNIQFSGTSSILTLIMPKERKANQLQTELLMMPIFATLKTLENRFDMSPLVRNVAHGLVKDLLQRTQARNGVEALDDQGISQCERSLQWLVQSGMMDEKTIVAIVTALLSADLAVLGSEQYRTAITGILRTSSQLHPKALDAAIVASQARLQANADDDAAAVEETETAFRAVLNQVFQDAKYLLPSATGIGLLVGLQHSSEQVRVSALHSFVDTVPLLQFRTNKPVDADLLGLAEAAALSLIDVNLSVCLAAWSIPVVKRIAAILPDKDFLWIVVKAVTIWQEKMFRIPEKSVSVLCNILDVISDADIIHSICRAKMKTPTSFISTGSDWLFRLLVTYIMDVPMETSKNESDNITDLTASRDKLCKAATTCAEIAGSLGIINAFFGFTCPEGANGTHEKDSRSIGMRPKSVEKALVRCLAQHVLDDKLSLPLLLSVVGKVDKSSDVDSSGASITNLSGLRLLCKVCLTSCEDGKRPSNIQEYLLAAYKALLQFLSILKADSISFKEVLGNFADLVHLYGKISGQSDSTLPPESNVWEHCVDSIGWPVLVSLLASEKAQLVGLVGLCLQSFFPKDHIAVLLKVTSKCCENSIEGSKMSQSGNSTATTNMIVPAVAGVGALYCLAAFVDTLIKTNGTLTANDAINMLMMCPITLSAVCSRIKALRVAGLVLAEALSRLVQLPRAEAYAIPLPKLDSIEAMNQDVRIVDVAMFGIVLHEIKHTVLADETGAPSVIGSALFSLSSIDNRSEIDVLALTRIRSGLLWTVCKYGWESPSTFLPTILVVSAAGIGVIWPFLKVFLMSGKGQPDRTKVLASSAIQCLDNMTTCSDESIKTDVTKWIINLCSQCAEQDVMIDAVLELIGRGWSNRNLSPNDRGELFSSLMRVLVDGAENKLVLPALTAVSIELPHAVSIVREGLTSFTSSWKQRMESNLKPKSVINAKDTSIDDEYNDNNEDEESSADAFLVSSGMAEPLQQLSSLLEVLRSPLSLLCDAEKGSTELALALSVVTSESLSVLQMLNDSAMRRLLSIEYTQSLLMDICYSCCNYLNVHKENAAKSTLPNSSSRKGKKVGLNTTNLITGLEQVLLCLEHAKTSQVQRSALQLTCLLVDLVPDIINHCLSSLGKVLAAATVGRSEGREKEKMAAEILQSFMSVLARKPCSDGTSSIAAQQLLQPFCENFQKLPAPKRSLLINLSLNALGEASAPACVAVMLSHVVAAYDTTDNTAMKSDEDHDVNEVSSSLILLSRAAQRKASRIMRTSLPEELFRLALDVTVARSANIALQSLVTIVRGALALTECISVSVKSPGGSWAHVVNNANEVGVVSVDMFELLNYTNSLLLQKYSDTSLYEGAGTLVLLLLEYVLEAIEHKALHRTLAVALDSATNSGALQSAFLELAENLLELISMASAMQEDFASEKMCLRLGKDTVLHIVCGALGKQIWTWSMEILKALQRLLDTPTFIAVLQELLDHDDSAVRQKALMILGQRLHSLDEKSASTEEMLLYHDLTTRLRDTISLQINPFISGEESVQSISAVAPLIQSALLCLDVLASRLGSRLEWQDLMSAVLADLCTFVKFFVREDTIQADELMGSLLLCSGTICSAVKARALPQLSHLMDAIVHCLSSRYSALLDAEKRRPKVQHNEGNAIRQQQKKQKTTMTVTSDEGVAVDDSSLTALLLLKSSISAATTIMVALPSFSHPHICKFVTAALTMQASPLRSWLHDAQTLEQEVDDALSIALQTIPLRLSLPALLQDSTTILSLGHSAVFRFSVLLGIVWSSLEREEVVAHMNQLFALTSVLLDYRHIHGEQHDIECGRAETAIVEAIVNLCLKLTENELRTWLNRLSEWSEQTLVKDVIHSEVTDNDVDDQKWRTYSRGVSFFSVLEGLADKLRSIFVQTMSVHWSLAAAAISVFISGERTPGKSSEGGLLLKKNKKRDITAMTAWQGQPHCVEELMQRAVKALQSICCTCNHAPTGFVDEFRYKAIINGVLGMYETRALLASDEEYEHLCDSFVSPCASALAVAAAKDVLWKPLNHKLLMLTRDKKPVVRLVTLRALRKLFVEVGEEYLMMLPECLPFFSELLEDDSEEVVTLAGDVIRYVEDLSGEKLEAYLQ